MRGSARPKRIALSGYYGFANAGDEAVLAGLINALLYAPGGNPEELDITVLSMNPERTFAEHCVPAAHRYEIKSLLRALGRCDLLASGGGSLLQDVTSPHSIFYYLGIVRAAQIMGKRTMFIAQGIGPLTRQRSRKLTAAVARRCSAITVRDEDSAALLRRLRVNKPEITVTADPALLLGDDTGPDRASAGAAISLRSWHEAPAAFAQNVARSCAAALGNVPIHSMAMSPSDTPVHRSFFQAFDRSVLPDGSEPLAWHALSRIASSSELVIGMRLHALILAAAIGVPSVALAYDPKINAFMEQTGQDDAIFNIHDTNSDQLTAMISRVWSERRERSERLRALLPGLRSAARRNAEVALSVLAR